MARQDDMPRRDDPTEIEPRPQPPPDRGPGATTAQLRRDIESGATGDKVPVLDPAAAPLGSDDEAGAGPPPRADEIAAARRAERAPGGRRAPEHPFDHGNGRDGNALTLLVAILLAVLLAGVALWLSFG